MQFDQRIVAAGSTSPRQTYCSLPNPISTMQHHTALSWARHASPLAPCQWSAQRAARRLAVLSHASKTQNAAHMAMWAAHARAADFQGRKLRLQLDSHGEIFWERWMAIVYDRYLSNLPDDEDEGEEGDSDSGIEAGSAWTANDEATTSRTDSSSSSTTNANNNEHAPSSATYNTSIYAASQTAAQAALDACYFKHFDNPKAHEPALRDKELNAAFRVALASAVHGRTVLDVGCGLGLLSMLCAQAGAQHVFAVEASAATAATAARVVAANGLADRVTVLVGRVEDVQLPKAVDVIVSNWMGPALLGGGMLRSVLAARDMWLRPGGRMLPGLARLLMTGVEDAASLLECKQDWDRIVTGFNMAPVMAQVIKQPRIDSVVRTSQLITNTVQLHEFDLSTTQAEDLAFQAPFTLTAKRDERLFGVALHFDVVFPDGSGASATPPMPDAATASAEPMGAGLNGQALDTTVGGSSTAAAAEGAGTTPAAMESVTFSSGPLAPPTHFEQVFLNFPRSIPMLKGETVTGSIAVSPVGPAGREVQLDLEIDYKGMVASISYALPYNL